jgi:hypothetical protein
MSAELEARVETLESLMADTLHIVRATGLEVDRLSKEMRAFKDEIRADTRAFKDAVNADTHALKEEMRALKIEMNKRWGDLSASLGLLVENIVAPSIPRVLSKVFACPEEAVESLGLRLRRKHASLPSRNREFDAVAAGCGYVLIAECKVRLTSRDVAAFAKQLPEAKEYFPEFVAKGYRFAGAVASLNVSPNVVAFAEKLGLIVLGSADDLMEVLNSPGFTPKTY